MAWIVVHCGEMRESMRTLRALGNLDEFAAASDLYFNDFHMHACGLCALWDFEQLGINAYKVVGRSDDVEAICTDIGLVARNVEIARDCESRQQYLENMQPPAWADIVCDRGLNCYYPDVAGW